MRGASLLAHKRALLPGRRLFNSLPIFDKATNDSESTPAMLYPVGRSDYTERLHFFFGILIAYGDSNTYGLGAVAENIRNCLVDGGALIIGGHESLPKGYSGFCQWSGQRAIFQKCSR